MLYLNSSSAEILELAGNAARNERNKATAGTNNSIEAAPISQQEPLKLYNNCKKPDKRRRHND